MSNGLSYLKNRKHSRTELFNYWRWNIGSGVLRFVERLIFKFNVSDRLGGNLTQVIHLPGIQKQVHNFQLEFSSAQQAPISIRVSKTINLQLQSASESQYRIGIKNAQVDLLTGLVFFDNGLILDGVLAQWQKLLYRGGIGSALRRLRRKKHQVNGSWTVLPHSPFFYHFLIEELPKVLNLYRAAVIDGVLITEITPQWAKQALEFYKVPYKALEHNSLEIEEYYCLTAPRAVLKSNINSLLNHKNEFQNNYLLSRGNLDRSSSEIELQIRSLNLASFQEIDPSDWSFADQMKLFSDSKSIIGLHGGALTNMVWMKSGGKVVEIFNHPFHTYDYARLAFELEHEYLPIFTESKLEPSQITEIVRFLND